MLLKHGLARGLACFQLNVKSRAFSFTDEFAATFCEFTFSDETSDSDHAAGSIEGHGSKGPELSVASSVANEPEETLSGANAKELAGSNVSDIGPFKLAGSGERSKRQRDGAYVVSGQDGAIARERGTFSDRFEGTFTRAVSGACVRFVRWSVFRSRKKPPISSQLRSHQSSPPRLVPRNVPTPLNSPSPSKVPSSARNCPVPSKIPAPWNVPSPVHVPSLPTVNVPWPDSVLGSWAWPTAAMAATATIAHILLNPAMLVSLLLVLRSIPIARARLRQCRL